MNPEAYRIPNERLILAGTLLLVFLVIAVSAAATVCGSLIFVVIAVLLAYTSSRAHHRQLVSAAYPVDARRSPGLHALAQECSARLRPGPVDFFVAPSRDLNAYTFGLSTPRAVVLYASLLQVMDADELRFILGHELGHVALGHTWLNSLVGGLAGIPTSSASSALLVMAFLSWNRTCELSADRAGLLACGQVEKAVSALIKLVAGPQAASPAGLEAAFRQIDAEDDTFAGALNESLATHPMLIRRITELRRYAATGEYRRLQASVAAVRPVPPS